MISACSSLVVQREMAAWGNQAVAVTCKPQAVSAQDWHDTSVVLVKKLGVEVTEGTPWGHPNKKNKTPILATNKFLPWSIMNDFLPLRKRGKYERFVRFQVDTAVVPTPTHSFLCLCFLFILSFASPNCDGVRLSACFFISSVTSLNSPPASSLEIRFFAWNTYIFSLNMLHFRC